jgi:hypothetical protein
MRSFIRWTAGLAAVGALAACSTGNGATTDADLAQDLARASAGSIELAPANGGTQVVSAIEQGPEAARASAAPQPRVAKHIPAPRPKAPVVRRAPARQVVEAPEPVQQDEPVDVAPAPAPSRPAVSPAPPGGYRSVGQIIRNAPFPINP